MLSAQDKLQLLGIARGSLVSQLSGQDGKRYDIGEVSDALNEKRGAFVTLTREGRLRGCIGTFRSSAPLCKVVADMAVSAAIHDPRFRPVTEGELGKIQIEISALTPLRRIGDIAEIEVGTHGLYITRGHYSGVLLPQVAVEYGWNVQEFLENTCLKAGLPPNSWREGASIEVFSAEVFSEEDPEGSKVQFKC